MAYRSNQACSYFCMTPELVFTFLEVCKKKRKVQARLCDSDCIWPARPKIKSRPLQSLPIPDLGNFGSVLLSH